MGKIWSSEVKKIDWFSVREDELNRINEGLKNRNIDASDVVSIIKNEVEYIVFYKSSNSKLNESENNK